MHFARHDRTLIRGGDNRITRTSRLCGSEREYHESPLASFPVSGTRRGARAPWRGRRAISGPAPSRRLAENPVHLGAARGARPLGHPAPGVRHDHAALEIALLTALDAVAAVGLGSLSHWFPPRCQRSRCATAWPQNATYFTAVSLAAPLHPRGVPPNTSLTRTGGEIRPRRESIET